MSFNEYRIVDPTDYFAPGLAGEQPMYLMLLVKNALDYRAAEVKSEILHYFCDYGLTEAFLCEVLRHYNACSECQDIIRQLESVPVNKLSPDEMQSINDQLEVQKIAGPDHPFNVEAEKERIESCKQMSQRMKDVFYLHIQSLQTPS